jgi:hypothetical protein
MDEFSDPRAIAREAVAELAMARRLVRLALRRLGAPSNLIPLPGNHPTRLLRSGRPAALVDFPCAKNGG